MDCVNLKHIFLESNLLYGNSNSGSVLSTARNATGLCRVAREICLFLEKKFLGREKENEEKNKPSPMEMCSERNAGVAMQEFMSREIFPQGPMRGKGKGGGTLGCVTQE